MLALAYIPLLLQTIGNSYNNTTDFNTSIITIYERHNPMYDRNHVFSPPAIKHILEHTLKDPLNQNRNFCGIFNFTTFIKTSECNLEINKDRDGDITNINKTKSANESCSKLLASGSFDLNVNSNFNITLSSIGQPELVNIDYFRYKDPVVPEDITLDEYDSIHFNTRMARHRVFGRDSYHQNYSCKIIELFATLNFKEPPQTCGLKKTDLNFISYISDIFPKTVDKKKISTKNKSDSKNHYNFTKVLPLKSNLEATNYDITKIQNPNISLLLIQPNNGTMFDKLRNQIKEDFQILNNILHEHNNKYGLSKYYGVKLLNVTLPIMDRNDEVEIMQKDGFSVRNISINLNKTNKPISQILMKTTLYLHNTKINETKYKRRLQYFDQRLFTLLDKMKTKNDAFIANTPFIYIGINLETREPIFYGTYISP